MILLAFYALVFIHTCLLHLDTYTALLHSLQCDSLDRTEAVQSIQQVCCGIIQNERHYSSQSPETRQSVVYYGC